MCQPGMSGLTKSLEHDTDEDVSKDHFALLLGTSDSVDLLRRCAAVFSDTNNLVPT